MKLKFANKILKSRSYQEELKKLHNLEKQRVFCKHDIGHFLTVARLTMLLCHEKGIEADADLVYSAALLHDIGRAEEYTGGVPHDRAGKLIAENILTDIGCDEELKCEIIRLIGCHRNNEGADRTLESVFYEADKKSRICFDCSAQEECNWSLERRNMDIEV